MAAPRRHKPPGGRIPAPPGRAAAATATIATTLTDTRGGGGGEAQPAGTSTHCRRRWTRQHGQLADTGHISRSRRRSTATNTTTTTTTTAVAELPVPKSRVRRAPRGYGQRPPAASSQALAHLLGSSTLLLSRRHGAASPPRPELLSLRVDGGKATRLTHLRETSSTPSSYSFCYSCSSLPSAPLATPVSRRYLDDPPPPPRSYLRGPLARPPARVARLLPLPIPEPRHQGHAMQRKAPVRHSQRSPNSSSVSSPSFSSSSSSSSPFSSSGAS